MRSNRFEVGQRVKDIDGFAGTVVEVAEDMTKALKGWRYKVVWDCSPLPDLCTTNELRPLHEPLKPGIGAVVSMVAAARMAFCGWGVDADDAHTHWDWLPFEIGCDSVTACGAGWRWDNSVPAGEIDEVTCPACLRMHERVYGRKVVRDV